MGFLRFFDTFLKIKGRSGFASVYERVVKVVLEQPAHAAHKEQDEQTWHH